MPSKSTIPFARAVEIIRFRLHNTETDTIARFNIAASTVDSVFEHHSDIVQRLKDQIVNPQTTQIRQIEVKNLVQNFVRDNPGRTLTQIAEGLAEREGIYHTFHIEEIQQALHAGWALEVDDADGEGVRYRMPDQYVFDISTVEYRIMNSVFHRGIVESVETGQDVHECFKESLQDSTYMERSSVSYGNPIEAARWKVVAERVDSLSVVDYKKFVELMLEFY